MESWRKVLRDGVFPNLSTVELEALKSGVERDDPCLLQGATTSPPPLQCVQDWPCEGACLLGYAGWKGRELDTVGEVELFFAQLCFQCDLSIGESAMSRFLLNFFDDTPRDEMRLQLLPELRREIARRAVEEESQQTRTG